MRQTSAPLSWWKYYLKYQHDDRDVRDEASEKGESVESDTLCGIYDVFADK